MVGNFTFICAITKKLLMGKLKTQKLKLKDFFSKEFLLIKYLLNHKIFEYKKNNILKQANKA